MRFPHIAARLFNTPLLGHPQKVEAVLWGLRDRIGIDIEKPAAPDDASLFVGSRYRSDGALRAFAAHEGVAIIRVVGSLANRWDYMDAQSGIISYESLAHQIAKAAEDDDIHSVILDIDSFGGEAGGCFTLTEQIRALRGRKRIVACVNDHAYSAAYAIASAADEIAISATSCLGSIGVVWVHFDHSVQLEMEGIRPTIIHAGARKGDGNPFEPLSKDSRNSVQERVNAKYEIFLQEVHAGRGERLTVDAARATEAGSYTGKEAIDAGLADRIAPFSQILEELSARGAALARRQPYGGTMAETTGPTEAETFTKEQMDTARERALSDGYKCGIDDERERIAKILRSEHAEGREAQAQTLALDSDIDVATAEKLLAASPKGGKIPPLSERVEESELNSAPDIKQPSTASSWQEAHEKVKKARG